MNEHSPNEEIPEIGWEQSEAFFAVLRRKKYWSAEAIAGHKGGRTRKAKSLGLTLEEYEAKLRRELEEKYPSDSNEGAPW